MFPQQLVGLCKGMVRLVNNNKPGRVLYLVYVALQPLDGEHPYRNITLEVLGIVNIYKVVTPSPYGVVNLVYKFTPVRDYPHWSTTLFDIVKDNSRKQIGLARTRRHLRHDGAVRLEFPLNPLPHILLITV